MARSKVVVLISGRGSNLQALMADMAVGVFYNIIGVISDKPNAKGLQLAREAGIATRVLTKDKYPDRLAYDEALKAIIESMAPDFVVLAGFMRILSAPFVEHYRGRLLNIHPSLLPKFKGLDPHTKALAAGESYHGASVHFVTPDIDSGPVIVQLRVPVMAEDTPKSLAARVLKGEHLIYPLALRWLSTGQVDWHEGPILFQGLPLAAPILLELP